MEKETDIKHENSNSRKKWLIFFGIILLIIILGTIFFINKSKFQTCDRTDLTTEEIAVESLLRYSKTSPCFSNLEKLSNKQKQALNKSLNSLRGKNFVVFDREIIILKSEDEVKVYEEDDLVYLQIKKKERILLENLSYIDEREDCSIYPAEGIEEDHWDYVMCYIKNYAKDNPNVWIGEDEILTNYLKNYLKDNVENFEEDYNFSSYDDVIEISPTNPEKIGIFFREGTFTYDKMKEISTLESFKEIIFNEDTNTFVIIEGENINPFSVYPLKNILENDIIENMITGNIVINTIESPLGANCNYDDQREEDSVLPCNNKINYFSDQNEAPDIIVEGALNKLTSLGYEVTHESLSESYPLYNNAQFLNKLISSNAQFLATSFHGSKAGYSGPVMCFSTRESGINWVKNHCEFNECILFGSSPKGACPVGYGLGIKLPSYNTHNFDFATHLNLKCYGGASYSPYPLTTIHTSGTLPGGTNVLPQDTVLLTKYLLGQGPNIDYYNTYPPALDKKENMHTTNLMDFGGPENQNVIQAWWKSRPFTSMICETSVSGKTIQIPCDVYSEKTNDANPNVHFFPYVKNLSISTDLEKSEFTIEFSDKVTKPEVNFYVVNDKDELINVIKEGEDIENTGKIFSYEFAPEVEIIDKVTFEGYDEEQKRETWKNLIHILGARASVGKNNIEMVGNPLAVNIQKGPSQSFWLYDEYFWNYNARAFSPSNEDAFSNYNIHEFLAKVPFGLKNPEVTSVDKSGNNFVINFNLNVSTNGNVNIDVDEKCYTKDGEKLFNPIIKQPSFNGDGEKADNLEFRLNGDLKIISSPMQQDYFEQGKIIVKVSDIESYPTEFTLMGNANSPTKWAYDMDRNGEQDAFENNGEEKGDFEIWFLCEIPEEEEVEEGSEEDWPKITGERVAPWIWVGWLPESCSCSRDKEFNPSGLTSASLGEMICDNCPQLEQLKNIANVKIDDGEILWILIEETTVGEFKKFLDIVLGWDSWSGKDYSPDTKTMREALNRYSEDMKAWNLPINFHKI